MQNANPHSDLQDIGSIVPLNDSDIPCIREIRDVLIRHGMIDRFGVTLLHSHFEIHDGETLVEFSDVANRELTFKTLKQNGIPSGSIVETMWRLDESESLMSCLMNCEKDDKGNHSYRHTNSPS